MAPTRDNLACKKFPDRLPVCWSCGLHVVALQFHKIQEQALELFYVETPFLILVFQLKLEFLG